jgi:glycosyltransferase involved in cell wall biosynthesis
MYKLKKKWFTNVKNMTIVTPSQWLADLVKQSFLKDYPVRVINNGIDLSIFKPMPNDFRKKYGIPEDKYIVLGVAFGWGKRKGLDVFIALSQKLDSKKYQIVLVGTDDVIDKILPKNIISIHRTHDPLELAQIYTSADVFANPSREENFPTVNIEALACGTPIVTFDIGGSAEIVSQGTGFVVTCDDIEGMKDAIIYLCSHKQHFTKSCLNRAKVYDMNNRFQEYSKLYLEKCGESNAS